MMIVVRYSRLFRARLQNTRQRAFLLLPAAAIAVSGVAVSTAYAQGATRGSAPAGNPVVNDGTFIISREVPFRSAIDPGVPAEPNRVVTAPTNQILATVDLGLEPLSDEQSAAINAPVGAANQYFDPQASLAPIEMEGGAARSTFVTSSNMIESATGGAIRQALGVLPGALGIISETLGAGE